jgi:hypothetical protein
VLNTMLHSAGSLKYLGVILDAKMTWREHVKQSVKLGCVIGLLVRPGVINLKLYIGFYIVVVRPTLMYVIVVRWPRRGWHVCHWFCENSSCSCS